jgi:hypothetical protein
MTRLRNPRHGTEPGSTCSLDPLQPHGPRRTYGEAADKRAEIERSQVWPGCGQECQERDAAKEAGNSSKRPRRQGRQGKEPQAGDRDRAFGSQEEGRQGSPASQEVQQVEPGPPRSGILMDMVSRSGFLIGLGTLAFLAGGRPCRAQTVVRDSALPPADSIRLAPDPNARRKWDSIPSMVRTDTTSAPRAVRPDSGNKPAAAGAAPGAPAKPPDQPAPDPYPKGVCTADVPESGGDAPDILMVTFVSRAKPADREAALKTVNGTLVAPDPGDPRIWYVHVASDGNEFVLRSIADRLIRARSVSEVAPVQCPPRQ